MNERRPIDLEEQIRRMKVQAHHRLEHERRTRRWILALLAFGAIFVIIASWVTGFASTSASQQMP